MSERPKATIAPLQLLGLAPEETIHEVTTCPDEGWIEIAWGEGRRARLTLDEINDERDDEIEPLVRADLVAPRLRQGKKLLLGKRVVDAAWLISLAEAGR